MKGGKKNGESKGDCCGKPKGRCVPDLANDTNFRKDVIAAVRENCGRQMPVFRTVIPATVRLAEVITADKSIFKHDPRGKAAEAYRSLVQEVSDIGTKQRQRSADIGR